MTKYLRVVSLCLGPALLALSTFFWHNGRHGVPGGVMAAMASIVWVYGLIGIWERLQTRMPKLSALGLVMTLLGTFGGICFGAQGFYEGIFGQTGAQSLAAAARYPIASSFMLWWAGPMFPLSMVLLGVVLYRSALVSKALAVGAMVAGTVFPVSRIPRIEVVAHIADFALLATSVWLAVMVLRGLLDDPAIARAAAQEAG